MTLEQVGEIYNALKNENRIQALNMVDEGLTLSEIADDLEMSYSGVHSYLVDMEEAHLVKEEGGSRGITEAGRVALDATKSFDQEMEPVLQEMWKQQVEKDSEEFGMPSPFSDQDTSE